MKLLQRIDAFFAKAGAKLSDESTTILKHVEAEFDDLRTRVEAVESKLAAEEKIKSPPPAPALTAGAPISGVPLPATGVPLVAGTPTAAELAAQSGTAATPLAAAPAPAAAAPGAIA